MCQLFYGWPIFLARSAGTLPWFYLSQIILKCYGHPPVSIFPMDPLFIMALLARGEIILMVTGRVAPIDAWLAHRGNVSGYRRRRM